MPCLLVALVVAFAPWPRGAAEPEWAWGLHLLAAILLVLFAARPQLLGSEPVDRPTRILGCGIALLVGLGILQLIPLGPLAELLSPNSSSLRTPFVPEGFAAPTTLSLYPHETRIAVCRWATAAVLLLATTRALPTVRAARFVAGALVVSAALNATLGGLWAFSGESLPWVGTYTTGRASGSYASPNHFAGLLALSIPLCLALSGIGVKPSPHLQSEENTPGAQLSLWLLPAGAMLYGVVLSGSRSGALAALTGIGLYVLIMTPGGLRKVPPPLLVAVALLGLLVATAGLNPLTERFARALDPEEATRFAFWGVALEILARFPLFGAGISSHEQLTPALLEHDLLLDVTHNDYLNLLADCGLVGGLLAMIVLVAYLVRARSLGRSLPSSPARAMFAGGVAGTASLLVACAFEFNLQVSANLWAFATAAGLALGSGSRRRQPTPRKQTIWLTLLRVAMVLGALALAHSATRQAMGQLRLHEGRHDELPSATRLAALTSAGAWDPELAVVPQQRGNLLMKDDPKAAQPVYRKACAAEPRNAIHHLLLARALLETGEIEAADQELILTVKLAPHFPNYTLEVGRIWLWTYQFSRSPERLAHALWAYRHALRWKPRELPAIHQALRPLLGFPRSTQLELLLPPEVPQVRRELTALLTRDGHLADAARILAPLTSGESPTVSDLMTSAELLVRLRDPFAAEEIIVKAVGAAEESERGATVKRGWQLLRGERFPDRAASLLETLRELHQQDAFILHGLGTAYLEAGDHLSAVRTLELARDLGSEESGIPLGTAFQKLGRGRSTLSAWYRALGSPLRISRRIQLSLMLAGELARQSRNREAIEVLEAARRLDPGNKAIHAELGRLREEG